MHHAETGNGARIADVVLARLCRDGQGALEKPLGFVELVLLEMQEREGAQDVASVAMLRAEHLDRHLQGAVEGCPGIGKTALQPVDAGKALQNARAMQAGNERNGVRCLLHVCEGTDEQRLGFAKAPERKVAAAKVGQVGIQRWVVRPERFSAISSARSWRASASSLRACKP